MNKSKSGPKNQFEKKADILAKKAWEIFNLELPVNLALVTEKLGIVVDERPFIEQIDGFYLRLPGKPPVIAINNSPFKSAHRRRFTLAHEIGHHLLGSNSHERQKLCYIDTPDIRLNILEKSCDRFAATLLMPQELIETHFNELATNKELRTEIMANRFDVSILAMECRLREMGLITTQSVRNR